MRLFDTILDMVGALSIVRFRNVIKEAFDIALFNINVKSLDVAISI